MDKKNIIDSGIEVYEQHRADYKTCPSCSHNMDYGEWNSAAKILVLSPRFPKSGCVTVISECPKCFEPSWVHEKMDGFIWHECWTEDWKEAVRVRFDMVKLLALREWGAALCYRCKHLTGGSVNTHCWRDCIVGVGEPRKECNKFEEQ